ERNRRAGTGAVIASRGARTTGLPVEHVHRLSRDPRNAGHSPARARPDPLGDTIDDRRGNAAAFAADPRAVDLGSRPDQARRHDAADLTDARTGARARDVLALAW